MKKIVLLITILITITNIYSKIKIGYFDYSVVLAFHPLMKNYMINSEKFLVDNKLTEKNIDFDKIRKDIELNSMQEKRDIKYAIDSAIFKKESLENLKSRLFDDYNKFLDKIKDEYKLKLFNKDKLQKKKLLDEMNSIISKKELEMNLETKKLKAQIKKLDEKLAELDKKLIDLDVTSLDYSFKQFKKIRDDIKEAITVIDERYNFDIIINTELSELEQEPKIDDSYSELNVYNEYFNSYTENINKRVSPYKNFNSITVQGNLDRWYKTRKRVMQFVNNRFKRKLFFKGGKNITSDILKYILKKYNIDSEKRREIIEFINEKQN